MKDKLKNPIIPGFYPDPTICRVGDDYYLACSSFELYPGIPLFHSKDLIHWEQICNVMTKENGFHVEKNSMVGGVMAPTLRYNNGTFYIINTNFSDRGNYIVTAKDPAGPWSEPHWMDDVPGIDASIFFDDDGKAYVMGTGNVWDNGAGVMERGIWLAEYDMENFRMAGEPVTIYNSALRGGASPEAPHIYHIGEYYYLITAEGGTEHYHAVMVARSKELFGFYEGNPGNPVMTHRHMGFKSPIINVGHADLVELPDGSWYAVMLASRLIDGAYKNLGRETFICPVVWERDWPLFSPQTGKMEWEYEAPMLPEMMPVKRPDTYDFSDGLSDLRWVFWGTPYGDMYRTENGRLFLKCYRQRLYDDIRPMNLEDANTEDNCMPFVAQRQCSMDVTVGCGMHFLPKEEESAGLAIVQAMNHQLHLERVRRDGKQLIQLARVTADYPCPPYFPGFECRTSRRILAEAEWYAEDVVLEIEIHKEDFLIKYGVDKEHLTELCHADGAVINPEKVGCMSGTIIGMFATGNGTDCKNEAVFDWFEMKEE